MTWEKLKGKFVVLDGPDGCGKSTQLHLLGQHLRDAGISFSAVRDPGGTRIGEQIRNILLDNDNHDMAVRCECLLYMASRAQLYEQSIAPALEEQQCVLCDRWVSSTYAYQAVAGRMGADAVLKLADIALQRTWPDLTVIIDLPSELALARVGAAPDRMENKSALFHQQVQEAFLRLARTRSDFRVVDGSGSVAQVHERVCAVLSDYVNS